MRLNIFLFTITAIIIDVVFALPASSSSASGSAEPPKTSSKKPFDLSTKLREELEFDTKVLAVTMGIGYAGYLAAHAMELIHGQPYRILRAPNRRKYRVTIQQGIDFDNCLALMTKPKADDRQYRQFVFDQCLRYARYHLAIEDILKDYQPPARPDDDDGINDNDTTASGSSSREEGNNDGNNNHFSQVMVEKGSQFVGTVGENVKNMLPGENRGRVVTPFVGLKKNAPVMRLVPPL